jgi:hypothetical protein
MSTVTKPAASDRGSSWSRLGWVLVLIALGVLIYQNVTLSQQLAELPSATRFHKLEVSVERMESRLNNIKGIGDAMLSSIGQVFDDVRAIRRAVIPR